VTKVIDRQDPRQTPPYLTPTHYTINSQLAIFQLSERYYC